MDDINNIKDQEMLLEQEIALSTDLDRIFAVPEEALLVPEEQPVSNTQQVPQQTQELVDQGRYQYWQSQYDKMRNDLEQYEDIFAVLKKNPDKANEIRAALFGQGIQQQQQQAPQQEEPQRSIRDELSEAFYTLGMPPEPPQRPYNFNMADAINDPNSESARYYAEFLEWQNKMTQYNNARVAHLFNIYLAREEQKEEERRREAMLRAQQEAEARKIQEIKNELKSRYSMNDAEAESFLEFIYKPNVTMDDLVAFYKNKHGTSVNKYANELSNIQQMYHQQKMVSQQMPQSIAVMPSVQEQPSFERMFLDSSKNTANSWLDYTMSRSNNKKGG